jgi:hypothetical protein
MIDNVLATSPMNAYQGDMMIGLLIVLIFAVAWRWNA